MRSTAHLARRRLALALAFGLGVVLCPGTPARAQEQAAGAPGDWLASFQGAQYMGLGGARLTTTNDPLGVVWNPAATARLDQNEVHFETARLFGGTSINSFSLAAPGRRLPTLGIAILALQSADFERTNDLNEPLGSFRESDMAFILSASREWGPRLAVGGSAKVVRHAVEEFGATGFGGDLGMVYAVSPDVSLGASVLNLGGPRLMFRETTETYATEFRAGLSVRLLSGRGLVSAGIDRRADAAGAVHGGGELRLAPRLALRLGYDERRPAGGFSYLLGPSMRLDYGLIDHDLGLTHRVGISFRFAGFSARSQAVPPVFSPLAEPAVTRLELVARTKAAAGSWTLTLTDKSKQVVRRFGGEGQPPAQVMWDGKDEAGLTVPDGCYEHQLVVVDREGRHIVGAPRTVEITTAGPQGTVPVNVRSTRPQE